MARVLSRREILKAQTLAGDWIQQQIEKLLEESGDAISDDDWEGVKRVAQAIVRLDPVNSDTFPWARTDELRVLSANLSQSKRLARAAGCDESAVRALLASPA
jgi:hypothetical protein